VARFTDTPGHKDGTFRGNWIPLVPGTRTVIDDPGNPGRKLRLREIDAFAAATDAEVQALILIKTRQAADAVGATMMDRPEWIALRSYDRRDVPKHTWDRWNSWGRSDHDDDSRDDWDHRDWGCDDDPFSDFPEYSRKYPLELYCTLTNNNRRGGGGSTPATSSNNPDGSTAAASARPAVDVSNPRPDNDYGHIIRWREDGNMVTALGFEWDIFVLCGDTITTKSLGSTYVPTDLSGVGYKGNIVDVPNGSADFAAGKSDSVQQLAAKSVCDQ
jgi:secreted PhoX family phosphatase